MFTLTIIFVVSFCLWYYLKNREYLQLVSRLPGPRGLDLIRLIFNLVNLKHADVLPYIAETCEKYGRVLRVRIGVHCLVFLTDPNDVEKILTYQKSSRRTKQYKFGKDLLKTSILIASGSKWHSRRKLIMPAFNSKILEQFVLIFEKHGAILVDKLIKSKMESSFDILEPLTKCNLNVICGEF
jgi:cytochrome P450 family 4